MVKEDLKERWNVLLLQNIFFHAKTSQLIVSHLEVLDLKDGTFFNNKQTYFILCQNTVADCESFGSRIVLIREDKKDK